MNVDVRLRGARIWANPAPIKARLLAYTIDVIVVVAAGVTAGMLLRSAVIGVVMGLQVAGILVIAEARSGVTLGNKLVNLRTTRDDVPYSLGFCRAWLRAAVQGVSFLVGGIGGWVLTATGLSDPHQLGRSWADRAGRALVVKVLEPEELEALSGWIVENRDAVAAAQQPLEAAPAGAGEMVQGVPSPGAWAPQPSFGSGAHAQALSGTLSAPLVPEPASAGVEPAGPRVLLRLDTGQLETFAVPGAVNLGRRPDRHATDDQLLAVDDPDRSVSGNHLRIEILPDAIWLTDLNSTNGTEVFDDTGAATVLPAGQRIRLEEGARVRIGNRSFTVALVSGSQ